MNYKFNWAIIFSDEYGQWFLDGLSVTLQLSGLSILLAMLLGTLLTVLRLSRVKPLEWLAAGYIEFFRNTPLVVQIFFWYFGSDPLLPPFFKEWLYRQNIEFATGVIALTTYTAAFLAEELRSGILSIPKPRSRLRGPRGSPSCSPCATSFCRKPSGSSFRRSSASS
jgi:polar amino acid transport system permease protein